MGFDGDGVTEWDGGADREELAKTWAMPPVARDQLVLFESSLEEVIPDDHLVRVLDEILRSLDWGPFESKSHGTLGARPVHPRVLTSIILYGHLTRVRSSRQLEAALWCRVDFRWLAEGWQLDHSTLSIFRKDFADLLQGTNTTTTAKSGVSACPRKSHPPKNRPDNSRDGNPKWNVPSPW